MPLRKSPSHPDVRSRSRGPAQEPVNSDPGPLSTAQSAAINVMRTRSRSRSHSGSPRDLVRLRTWKLDTLTEAPQVDITGLGDAAMSQFDIYEDQTSTPEKRLGNSPVIHTAVNGNRVFSSPETSPWSSAVGPATTAGKSGRVIERLQQDVDRLNREKNFTNTKYEESEKARENLSIQNASLLERNGVLEQSEEITRRNMARLERKFEELKVELSSESARRETAEQEARNNVHAMHDAKSDAERHAALAAQADNQYQVLTQLRQRENDRYQMAIDQMRLTLQDLLQQRDTEVTKIRRLEVIAEQKDREIIQLVEINRKLGGNFESYKKEKDDSVVALEKRVADYGTAVEETLRQTSTTVGEMKWVMNVTRDLRSDRDGVPKTGENSQ